MDPTEASAAPADSPVLEMGGKEIEPGGRVGPYVYKSLVGRGGMAHVVRAEDPDGREVALKILRPTRFKTGLPRFRREFRAMARIHHPNVIRVEAYGDIYGHPYIAMEYVEGDDLHTVIRSFKHLSTGPESERWRRCEHILVDVCRALAHIHARGLVHRDLKPSNILLNPEGRAKLTDFGIVKDLLPTADPDTSSNLVGTWAYASPEQITGRALDHRADLYSLGVILFAMLTGRRPFAADDIKGYRKAHLELPPARPRDLMPDMPQHLEEICLRLLRKSPRDRFQSAREILFRLEQAEPDHPERTEAEGWMPPLVGRGAEVELLQRSLTHLQMGEGGLILLEGRAGAGKSRLLETVLRQAADLGIHSHVVRARDGVAGIQGLLDLARQVRREIARPPPLLVETLELWSQGGVRGADAPYRLFDGLRDGLLELLAHGPRLLIYDDLHWTGDRELELLGVLARMASDRPLLLIGARRSEVERPLLDRLSSGERTGLPARVVPVELLSEPAVAELVSGLIGRGDKARALATRLRQVTEGNPLFIHQYLASLLQTGVLTRTERGFELGVDTEEIISGHMEIPHGVREVVSERIDDLSPRELRALRLLVVAGRELDLDLLLDVLCEDEEPVLDALDHLLRRGIIVEHREPGHVAHEVAHQLVGEMVYRDLSPEMRRSLHKRLARTLEAHQKRTARGSALIGEHYRLAGEAGKAFCLLVEAAERMHRRWLTGEAWELANRAAALEDLARVDLTSAELGASLLHLLHVQGEVLYGRGEWELALRAFERLLEVASKRRDAREEVRARIQVARTLHRTKEDTRAQQLATEALGAARRNHDREAVAMALHALASFAWDAGDLERTERLAQEGLVLAVGDGMAHLRGELLLALTVVQAARGSLTLAARGLVEAEGILQLLGRKSLRTLALCNLAEMLIWQGQLSGAIVRAEEALSIATELDYRVGQVVARRIRAEALLELGHPEARSEMEQALSEAAEIDLTNEMIGARHGLARLAAARGDAADTEAHVSVARALAQRQDPERYAPALVALKAWACAFTGDIDDATRMLAQVERTLDKLQVPRRCQVMLSAAQAHAALDADADARRLAGQAAALAGARGFRLWDLQARWLLARVSDTPVTAAGWRGEAEDRARSLHEDLDEGHRSVYRARPEVVELLGAP